MSSNITDVSSNIPANITRRIAELIASYEIAVDKMIIREKEIQDRLQRNEYFINEQIDKVNALLADFREVMTEAGAARWRISAENVLRQGKDHVKTLQDTAADIKKTLKENCDKFDRVSAGTVKTVNEAVASFRISDFKELTEKSCIQVKEAATGIIGHVTEVIKWFHWKNLAMAFGLSLMIAVIMGLYINDEWPWEMHANIVQQRAAGRALINAWPHLNKNDQQYLAERIIKVTQDGSN